MASRDLDRAKAWIESQKLDAAEVRAFGSYQALLDDAEVDAVYLPLPTTAHKEWVFAAADAGKHILLEKPTAVCMEDMLAMVKHCESKVRAVFLCFCVCECVDANANADVVVELTAVRSPIQGVLLMDGVMFMHHRRLDEVRRIFESGVFGRPSRVVSGFSFPAGDDFFVSNIRAKREGDPLGALGDLGWYCARFAMFSFDWAMPHTVMATATRSTPEGVPTEVAASLVFPEGRHCIFTCGFHSAFTQWVEVASMTHTLRIDDFVIANSPDRAAMTLSRPAGPIEDATRVGAVTHDVLEVRGCNQEATMFDTFASCARNPTSDAARWWPRIALRTQAVMDACMASVAAGGAATAVPTCD